MLSPRLLLAAGLVLAAAMPAHAALNAGDMAFTSFNADQDGWSMVSFVDIAANTNVYFSDNEWNGSAFNSGESFHQWASGANTIAAGTMIRFSFTDDASKLNASLGSLTRASVTGSSNFGINQTADTVYAYVGSSATAPTTFLSAISNGGFSDAEGGLNNTGLTQGTGAIKLKNSSDFAQYNGARSGLASMAAYKAQVLDVANWVDNGDGSFATLAPNMTDLAVSAVPEPSSYAMLMAGLGLCGVLARRRKQA